MSECEAILADGTAGVITVLPLYWRMTDAFMAAQA